MDQIYTVWLIIYTYLKFNLKDNLKGKLKSYIKDNWKSNIKENIKFNLEDNSKHKWEKSSVAKKAKTNVNLKDFLMDRWKNHQLLGKQTKINMFVFLINSSVYFLVHIIIVHKTIYAGIYQQYWFLITSLDLTRFAPVTHILNIEIYQYNESFI